MFLRPSTNNHQCNRPTTVTCLCRLLLLAALLLTAVTSGWAAESPVKTATKTATPEISNNTIQRIVVLGNRKVTRDTITGAMKSQEGSPYSPEVLDQDLVNLYKLGLFDNLLANLKRLNNGVEIGLIVVEKPTIAAIVIKGNKEIERKELLKEITLHTFNLMNEEKLQESVTKLKDFYREKGFYSVRIKTRTASAGRNRVKLVFIIDEGPKCYVKEIRFHGNENFSGWTLRRKIQTKTYNFFLTWITDAGLLKKDQLSNDVKILKSFYLSKGYVQVKISQPKITLSQDRKWIYLDFNISEGPVFAMGKIEIIDPESQPETLENLLKILKSQPGKTFSNLNLQSDIDTLSNYYADRGFAYVDIDPQTKVDPKKRTVSVSYHINRGTKFYFGRIAIHGNFKTRDKVIRRELRFAEGDLFSASALKRSRERINNTQYFSEADIQTAQKSEDTIDVNVKVVEGSTGTFSVGLGYSTVDSIIGVANISQSNWLGKGLNLDFNVEMSGSRQHYNIGLTDPWFLDMDMNAGFNIFNDDTQYDAYDTIQRGFRAHIGKPIDEYTSWSFGYSLEKVKIYNIDPTASDYIWDQRGTTTTSQIFFSITRDKRNNYLFPTRGYKIKGTGVIAGGPLGFDNDFYKVILEGHKFYPFFWNSAWHFWSRFGYADGYNGDELPLYERFYVGGLKTVRGFDFGEAGPEDENGDVIGGTKELILSGELIFPLIKNMGIRGVVFYDAGRAWDDDENMSFNLRHSVGFGIRWKSPMGPLRIEWGFNLSPKDDEKSNVWDFSIGSFF